MPKPVLLQLKREDACQDDHQALLFSVFPWPDMINNDPEKCKRPQPGGRGFSSALCLNYNADYAEVVTGISKVLLKALGYVAAGPRVLGVSALFCRIFWYNPPMSGFSPNAYEP